MAMGKRSKEARHHLLTLCLDPAIDAICSIAGLTQAQLISRSRKDRTVISRAIVYDFLYVNFEFSTCEIGGVFGRNHSTVLNALKKIKGYLEYGDKETTELFGRFYTYINML